MTVNSPGGSTAPFWNAELRYRNTLLSWWNAHNGVPNARGYENNVIFDQYLFVLEIIQDRAIVTMEC